MRHVGGVIATAVGYCAVSARNTRLLSKGSYAVRYVQSAATARKRNGRSGGGFLRWAIQDSNLGPLPYQKRAGRCRLLPRVVEIGRLQDFSELGRCPLPP